MFFTLGLMSLWLIFSGQLLTQTMPYTLIKLTLSALVVSAALARYQRYNHRLLGVKRVSIAVMLAICIWLVPASYNSLILVMLPIALLILLLNALGARHVDHPHNIYSRFESIIFICLNIVAFTVTCLSLANYYGHISNTVNLHQALTISIITNLLTLIMSPILRMRYDLSIVKSDQKFTKNLHHQITQQHATISQLNADLKMAHDRLKIDELTGLRNHEYFNSNLLLEINRTGRHKFPVSIVLIKVDGLSEVTEQYDYETSNRCLQQIAIRCQKQLKRSSDKVCRYHDETFALTLPDTHSQGAMQLGNELLAAINNSTLKIEQKVIAVNVNIGVATADSTPSLTAQALTEAAELALENAAMTSQLPISQIIISQTSQQ
jgi:diguanylate cyclase (GGDEF)-like protein